MVIFQAKICKLSGQRTPYIAISNQYSMGYKVGQKDVYSTQLRHTPRTRTSKDAIPPDWVRIRTGSWSLRNRFLWTWRPARAIQLPLTVLYNFPCLNQDGMNIKKANWICECLKLTNRSVFQCMYAVSYTIQCRPAESVCIIQLQPTVSCTCKCPYVSVRGAFLSTPPPSATEGKFQEQNKNIQKYFRSTLNVVTIS